MEKQAVINWFMSMSREAMLQSNAFNKRRVTDSDISRWSAFELRMREIAGEMNTYYKTYDITRKSIAGSWFFDATKFYMWVMANMGIIQRVPDFKPLWDTMLASRDATRRVSEIEVSKGVSPVVMQEQAQEIMKENYRQIEMIWGAAGDETPCNNMGVKK